MEAQTFSVTESNWAAHVRAQGSLIADEQAMVGAKVSGRVAATLVDLGTVVTEGDPLPEGRETLAKEFIHHLETGEPLHPTLDMMQNVEAMAILDAGIRSAASGKMELVNTPTWCIG